MKPFRRLIQLYEKQDGLCIWCGRKSWLEMHLQGMTDRQISEFLEIPYRKKHLKVRMRKRMATIEHVLQKCRGGSNKPINLTMACSDCNSKREHHGCSLNYDVLGKLHPEKQKWVQRIHKFYNGRPPDSNYDC